MRWAALTGLLLAALSYSPTSGANTAPAILFELITDEEAGTYNICAAFKEFEGTAKEQLTTYCYEYEGSEPPYYVGIGNKHKVVTPSLSWEIECIRSYNQSKYIIDRIGQCCTYHPRAEWDGKFCLIKDGFTLEEK